MSVVQQLETHSGILLTNWGFCLYRIPPRFAPAGTESQPSNHSNRVSTERQWLLAPLDLPVQLDRHATRREHLNCTIKKSGLVLPQSGGSREQERPFGPLRSCWWSNDFYLCFKLGWRPVPVTRIGIVLRTK